MGSLPKYSKNQVKRAGRILAGSGADAADHEWALKVLDYWRAAHALVLSDMAQRLGNAVAGQVGKVPTADGPSLPLVVSRLKRMDTIVGKLRRTGSNFQLNTMYDLAGCRAVVSSLDEVYEVLDNLKSDSSLVIRPLRGVIDYIRETPKANGYRSLHVITLHDALPFGYEGLACETQVRTELQHSWATALETYDVIKRGSMKFGGGSPEERRFFSLVSAAFAIIERCPSIPGVPESLRDIRCELISLERELCILARLRACSSSVNVVSELSGYQGAKYCILSIDYAQQWTQVDVFPASEERRAQDKFATLERGKGPMQDVLMVLVSSVQDLEAAYPNYSSDISFFLGKMDEILN